MRIGIFSSLFICQEFFANSQIIEYFDIFSFLCENLFLSFVKKYLAKMKGVKSPCIFDEKSINFWTFQNKMQEFTIYVIFIILCSLQFKGFDF